MRSPRRLPPAALLGAVVLLSAAQGCSGGSSGEASPACAELLERLRDSAAARVGSRGFSSDEDFPPLPERHGVLKAAESDFSPQGAVETGEDGGESSVAAADLVRSEGSRLLFVADGRLHIVDRPSREITHRLELPEDFRLPTDILVHGDRALLLSNKRYSPPQDKGLLPGPGLAAHVLYVDLAGPRILGSLRTDGGQVLDARQSGPVARLVLYTAPKIGFPRRDGTGREAAAERNRSLVRETPMAAFQPTYEVAADGKRTTHRVPCERITVPADGDDVEMLTVLTVDLAKGLGDGDPVSVAASGAIVYGTERSLYLTSSPWRKDVTQIHKFDLGEGRPRYAASGTVTGLAFSRYSMSEHEGYLRIAVSDKDLKTGSVHVLRPEGTALREVGSLSGLSRKEGVSFVRFAGDRGYAVSSRDEEPLRVLDLSDPREPRRLGELDVDGRIFYLHPLGGGRLLGAARKEDARGRTLGMRFFLFDTEGSPRRLSRLHLPKIRESQAEFRPHAFRYRPEDGLAVLDAGGRALVLSVEDDAVVRKGLIEHPRKGYIDRALVAGGELWTFTRRKGLKATDAAALTERAWIPW